MNPSPQAGTDDAIDRGGPVMTTSRRAVLAAGVGGGVAAFGASGRAAAAPGASAEPNPLVRGEDAHVSLLRRQLNSAADGDDRFDLDEAGRRVVTTKARTYILRRPLIVGGDTTLRAHGATFVADFPLEPKTWEADRRFFHSPTPTYPDVFETFRSTVGATLLLNHVPSDETVLYTAPGNIRVEGGVWDPTAHFIRNESGEDRERATAAPPMNAITFTHTHDIEVVDVTVRNVKWWHAVEFNGVKTATVRDSRFEGYIENPTAGLWTGDAVQVDLPNPVSRWAGAPDETPAKDIRILNNWCGESDEFPEWTKLGISHSTGDGIYFEDVWVERNTCVNLKWDAINPANVQNLVIRENTIVDCRGGIYVIPFKNSLTTVDVMGNTVSVVVDENNRPAIGIIGRSEDENISDVAVYGNIVDSGEFRYTYANFRREPQRE